ncbi:NUDIX hydrolase [Candidatus Parcubacteria bacterium]|jgi:8-oxo-dGTP pyrophosphatase MutT (NUDIX family)|nr:NUDIX hydrolase [Candidatus Parcubacteria bacterium]
MATKKDLEKFEKFAISQTAILIRDDKCLILKAASREKNMWVLPGGRLDKGELGEAAFARELKEEINFDNVKVLGVAAYDIWYHDIPHLGVKNWPICAIANLIEDTGQEVKISDEHTEVVWASEDDIENYQFIWPKAHQIIKKGFEYYRLLNK